MTETQILTAAQMQAAEQELFDQGTGVGELMEIAAGGAAEWIRRLAAGRSVTVLCGPGNNGGDGYVIARRLREAGNAVKVVAPVPPTTDAAKAACKAWSRGAATSGKDIEGSVFVDCLFGTGLSRPLQAEHVLLLRDLAARHDVAVAVDMPSGVASDTGAVLNDKLPNYDLTLALGAWKFAHWALPARAMIGSKRLVPIGIDAVADAARLISKPKLNAPAFDAHKYKRGFLGIVGGTMPGAALLAAEAAQHSGAGYVKLYSGNTGANAGPGLVVDHSPIYEGLSEERLSALLVGPGLGRDGQAQARLVAALEAGRPTVLDADALVLLRPEMLDPERPLLATPHDGELDALCRSFSVIAEGRRSRALALAKASGMVVCAKGPDSYVAAPDGRLAVAPPATTWLSTAGTGDVLAGIVASRMASGREPFSAACEAVWLHGQAAMACGPAFGAEQLAKAVQQAVAACL